MLSKKLKKDFQKLSKQELVQLLVECKNKDGIIDLSDLDFSKYEVGVNLSNIKVKHSLWQNHQQVGDSLFQDTCIVGENIYQDSHIVFKNIYQTEQWCDGDLHQDESKSRRWIDEEN